MKAAFRLIIGIGAASMLSACGSTLPLTFADKTTVGVDVSASEQGVDLVVGFKTKSLAIVPIAVRKKDTSGNYSEVEKLQAEDSTKKDAYSTFGNFTVDTKAQAGTASASIGLGRFFATGVAAQNIANKVGDALVEKAKK